MHQSRAIVLHQIKYSETSLILKIYTEKEGLLSFIVKGVRGKKGKLRTAQFQLLNLLELSYSQGKKSQLRHIADLKISEPFTELLFNPIKRSIGLFIAELIQHCIKEEEENVPLFNFLFNSIHWLDLSKDNCNHFHIYFMMKLTKYLGFSPLLDGHHHEGYFDLQQGAFSSHKPTHRCYIESDELNGWKELLNCNLESFNKLQFSNDLKRRMVQALMNYYKLHLIHFKELNSHHILQTVFENE
tara:strand:- start:1967 stop:2695 length:729 start_codon:yes stop_codon:yes gene_type:complete